MQDGSGGFTDAGGRWIYRAGGLCGFGIAAGYVAIIGLYAPMGAPPHEAAALLPYMSGHTGSWWAILALSASIPLVLLLPIFVL